MYSLLFKYEIAGTAAFALDPRIALPCNEMRALFAAAVVAVRARTARVAFALARFVAVVWRETTLRDDTAFARLAFVRFAFARVVTARDCTVLREFAARDAFAVVVRATVARDGLSPRELVRLERGDVRPLWLKYIVAFVGATGSANTERIDNIVEHTKKAPANKKTVPSAFLTEFANS